MAIPTTQKECTARRIASLIIGLWDKIKNAFLLKTSRGSANGVASLDANGKVPSSQLPTVPTGNLPSNSSSSAGIVASGSGQASKVWMTDSNGNPAWRTVTLPRSFINKNSQTTKVWKKIATSVVFTSYQKASITFFICADGYGYALGLESVISVSIRTEGGGSFSDAYVGKYNFRNSCSVELLKIGSTNQYEIWVKAPPSDTNFQIVYLNSQGGWTIDTSSDQSVKKTDSEYSTYKSSHPAVSSTYYHTYNIVKSSTSQIGGPSIPVYVNSNGDLVACTNVPVIEHVTTIPVNPTVGTIYAL